MLHYHVGFGIVGYGPDSSDEWPTFTELGEALSFARDELVSCIDQTHETAHAYADCGDFAAAWTEILRMETLEVLRANLDPARRDAPLYVDNPAAYRELQESQYADFPHDVAPNTRLYLWECSERECMEGSEDLPTESVTVTLVALPADDVPAVVNVERIAEDVSESAYRRIHELLRESESVARYGDIMPSELDGIVVLFRLLVRSVLANGKVPTDPVSYAVVHSYTDEVLLRTRARTALEALSDYSASEGFARPDRMTHADIDGMADLSEFLGYHVHGNSAGITFTNHEVYAFPVASDDDDDVVRSIARAMREIRYDVRNRKVPASALSFSELHDYVDANEYGGLCDDYADRGNDFGNAVQSSLDEWIRGGGLR